MNITSAAGTFDISGTTAGATITTLSGVANSNVVLGGETLTLSNASSTYSGIISGTGGALTLTSGSETLIGTNTYTGATTINGGTLALTGSIATSSLTTVNSSGTVTGTGTVGNIRVNSGGTFAPGTAPGTSMNVSDNLAFQSGAIYLVQVNPSSATSANVTGAAMLAGNVLAAFAPGTYLANQYDILHATGLGGTMFGALGTTNLPANFTANLSYTGTDVLLNLTATMGKPSGPSSLGSGLNINQQNVATSLNHFFNGGGTLTPKFLTVFGLTGGNLANALSQLSGEAATDAEKGSFEMMSQFFGLMLDPFVDGRGCGGASDTRREPLTNIPDCTNGTAQGFAPDQQASFPPDIALAYASVFKAPPPAPFNQRWTAWGSGFGASSTTNGNALVGSNNVTARDYGFAGGMDYHATPDTVYGFALAGGGTNWGLAQGFGVGRSDTFQAGLYGKNYFGPAYVAAALAFANNWFTTDRTALGDQLSARFDGQSYGGRLETGYRYGQPTNGSVIGVAPYAAVQTQWFHTPSYSEVDLSGGGFGLSYNAMTANDTRSELGARFDDPTLLDGRPLILRAQLAWAHDWVTNPALDAVFQSLQGASFVVNGAAPPKNSALTSAGAQLYFTSALSFLAKFDGEFAPESQTYAGTGTLRYTW